MKGNKKWRHKEMNRIKTEVMSISRIEVDLEFKEAASKRKRKARHERMIKQRNEVGDDARDARLARQNRTPGPDGH
jgi:hypothetical protein